MFYPENKALRRFTAHLGSVLVVDPFPGAASLLCELLMQLGARGVIAVGSEEEAERTLARQTPRLIFTEFGGGIDGPGFVRRLRRGDLAARWAPVIMCTAEATELSLKAARDSGVHEFLCKPFTVSHLVKRVEAACLKERDWIDSRLYVGPDRRRFNSGAYRGPRKRRGDEGRAGAAAPINAADAGVLREVLTGIRLALADFDADPAGALRTMVQQSAELQALAFASQDAGLRRDVAALQGYLLAALETNSVSRTELTARADALARFTPAEKAWAA